MSLAVSQDQRRSMVLTLEKLANLVDTGVPACCCGGIKSWEIVADRLDLSSWLTHCNTTQKTLWKSRDGNTTLLALGSAETLTSTSATDIDEDFARVSHRLSHSQARYYVGMRFDPNYQPASTEWSGFGAYRFTLPRVEIVSDNDGFRLRCYAVEDDQPLLPNNIANQVRRLADFRDDSIADDWPAPVVSRDPNAERWRDQVCQALSKIGTGEIEKVVMARQLILRPCPSLASGDLVSRLTSNEPDCFIFWHQVSDSAVFLGASPELLYQRIGRNLNTEAMAGTRPRGGDQDTDSDLARELLASKKDRAEQQFVLQGVLNRLDGLCSEVDRPDNAAPTVRKLSHVQHLVNKVEGLLRPDVADAQILLRLSPTPAVAGIPRETATPFIANTETFDRGWYAGPVGWFTKDQAEFAVAIRSALIRGDQTTLYAGAGIVDGSQPDNEWNETEAKLRSLLPLFARHER